VWRPKFTKRGGLWLPQQGLAMAGKFRFQPCATCCATVDECELCDGSNPGQWQVEISGILDGTCSDCDDPVSGLNGTFILNESEHEHGPFENCRWKYTLPDLRCVDGGEGFTSLELLIDFWALSAWRIMVVWVYTTGWMPTQIYWQKSWGASHVPCSTLVDEPIPYWMGGDDVCFADETAQCLVTAL
jgi:hypothetical protein